MKTPIQGFFTTSFMIGVFLAGLFAKTIPGLFAILIPLGIIWVIALIMAVGEAFSEK